MVNYFQPASLSRANPLQHTAAWHTTGPQRISYLHIPFTYLLVVITSKPHANVEKKQNKKKKARFWSLSCSSLGSAPRRRPSVCVTHPACSRRHQSSVTAVDVLCAYSQSATIITFVESFSSGAYWLILCGGKQKRQCEPLTVFTSSAFSVPRGHRRARPLCLVPS